MSFAGIERLECRSLLAAATLVKDIIAGPDSSVSISASQRGALGASVIFTAVDETHGAEPWISDGTAAGTHLIKDIRANGSSQPRVFTAGGAYLFFIADDGSGGGDEIWRTDGTAAQTVKVTNLAGTLTPTILGFVNNKLLFYTSGTPDGTLWRTDANGAAASVAAVNIIRPFKTLGSKQYFYGYNSTNDLGVELWSTDGTTAGVVIDISPGDDASNFGDDSAVYKNRLYFTTNDSFLRDSEPWSTDGTAGGTDALANLNPNDSSVPFGYTVAGANLYFAADDGTHGYQLYRSDGTTATRVTSFADSTKSSLDDLTDFNGTLFFTFSGTGVTRRLYKLVNGTTATLVGTTSGGADGGTSPGNLTPIGNTLYFSGVDANSKARLFQTDGTTITAVTGDAGFDPDALINVNGTLFYQASDDAHGSELHIVSGSPAAGPFTVNLKVVTGTKTTINEGGFINFTTALHGIARTDVSKYYWYFDGYAPGVKPEIVGSKPIHLYADNLPNDAVRKVLLKVVAKDGRIAKALLNITVKNVAPKFKISIPPGWVTYAPLPYAGTVIDPGVNDKVTYDIKWRTGEIVTGLKPDAKGHFSGVRVYTSRNLVGYDIVFTAHDKDGASSTTTKTVFIDEVFTDVTDALKALGVLGAVIGGTSGNDTIVVAHSDTVLGGFNVIINGVTEGTFETSDDLIDAAIYGGSGNDTVTLPADLKARVSVIGGSGGDTLNGKAIK